MPKINWNLPLELEDGTSVTFMAHMSSDHIRCVKLGADVVVNSGEKFGIYKKGYCADFYPDGLHVGKIFPNVRNRRNYSADLENLAKLPEWGLL